MTSALLSEVGRGEAAAGTTIASVPLSPEDVGARIVRAREEMDPKPWSQFDLAIALDVSPSTVYRWEKGKLPAMHELLRVAEVLRKPPDYLTESPEHQAERADLVSRLEALEAVVTESNALTREALTLLRAAQPQTAEGRGARKATGTR